MTPPEPRGGEVSVGQRAFEWMRDKNNAIPGARKDIRSWTDLSETDRRNFEEDAERRPSLYRDRPTAPSASGGEAVAEKVRVRNLILKAHKAFVNRNGPRFIPSSEYFDALAEALAHPARMPTREEVARVIEPDGWATVDAHQAEVGMMKTVLIPEACSSSLRKAAALLALFHTGETKEDGRG